VAAPGGSAEGFLGVESMNADRGPRSAEIDRLAGALARAEAAGEPLGRPGSTMLTADDAYRVQERFIGLRCARTGESVTGFKISMTSPETLALAGAREPAFGLVTSGAVLRSPARLSLREMLAPRVEPEIQFLVDQDLGPSADEEEIVRKCRVAAGLEVPDSRFRDWFGKVSLTDLIADASLAGRVVVGETARSASTLDLVDISVEVFLDEALILRGNTRTVMGNPVTAVTWLARRLAAAGMRVSEGMLVSSGTLAMPPALQEGTYRAVYDGLGEVRLDVTP